MLYKVIPIFQQQHSRKRVIGFSSKMKPAIFLVGVFPLYAMLSSVAQAQDLAQPCVPTNCTLPDCRCASIDRPGNFSLVDTPQLVFLSFDEPIHIDNYPLYEDVLFGRKNPNNQSITVTFYASHDYNNYSMIHELWRRGHEIGLNSISRNSSQAYWYSLDEAGWRSELVDQRDQMNLFAQIPSQDIVGVRAPQLLVGGDPMYNALEKAGLTYDCSRPTNAFRESGLWPYTNDYATIQDCLYRPCPEKEHPGFWTVPIINLIGDEDRKEPCSMADQCTPLPRTADATYNLLNNNFQRHYTNHRTPFGIFIRAGWINETAGDNSTQLRREGYVRFLDYLATLDDVFIVSVARGLEWVRNPLSVEEAATFPAFQITEQAGQCQEAYRCLYREEETPFKPPQERFLYSCTAAHSITRGLVIIWEETLITKISTCCA